MMGSHLIKSWSSTQVSPALSSGEAEFYGVVKASGVALGFQALLQDVDFKLPVRVWTDSTATMGVCGRQGLGKLRHIDTQCLWVQQRVRDGSIELRKVRGDSNPADLFTKHLLSGHRIEMLLKLFGCHYDTGRPEAAPALRKATGMQKGELLTLQAQGEHVELMEWYGQRFPKSSWDPEDGTGVMDVPDAYEHDPLLLPHEHLQLAEVFPRAVAAPEKGDRDPHRGDSWEVIGIQIGCEKGRGKRKVGVVAEDPR